MSRILLALALSGLALNAHAEPAPDSEAQLLLDLHALLADPYARPVSAPIAGQTFADLAGPHLAELAASRRRIIETEPPESIALHNEVFAGKRPLSELPAVWKVELAHERGAVAAVLRATHAESGKLPYPLTLFGLFPSTKQPYGLLTLQHAAKLANLLALEALQQGLGHQAATTCADALALARDASHGTLINQMIALVMVKVSLPTCRFVAERVEPADRLFLAQALTTSRAGWYPYAATLRQESLFTSVIIFGDTLSKATRAALPEEAKQFSIPQRESSKFAQGFRRAVFGSWARRTQVGKLREMEAATKLPPAEGDAIIEALDASSSTALTLAAYGDSDGPGGKTSWTGFIRRIREGQARLALFQLELAIRIAHDRSGKWPQTWLELGGSAPLDPRTGLPIALVGSEKGVRLVPADDGARTSSDLSIAIEAHASLPAAAR